MTMFRLIIIGLAVAMALPAVAQTSDEVRAMRRLCWDGDYIEQRVEVARACGGLIDAGILRGNELAHVHRGRGLALLNDRRFADAIPDLERSAELRPEMAETYVYLAMAWHGLGDRTKTLIALGQAERREPAWWPTNMSLGHIRLELRDYDGAARNYRVATRNGGGASAQNALCWTLAISNQALDEAMEACNRALRDKPFEQAFIDSRALVKFRLGDYAGAEADYVSAVAMDPDAAVSRYGRGLTRIRLGRIEQGRADIARAIEINPEVADDYAAWGLTP